MLADRIPDIISSGEPATPEQVEALEQTLGVKLPDEYRALLAEANGVEADLVTLYSAEELPERNETYEVAKYSPGYILIGLVNGFPVLVRGDTTSPVFENDWGAMTPDVMTELAPSLGRWIDRGCPDSEELAEE